MPATKTIFAKFSYQVGKAEVSQTLTANVSVEQRWHQWILPLEDQAQAILEREGISTGFLRYRLDGTNTPLSLMERIADWWYRATLRGVCYTGNRFIINWDAPDRC